jgi:hypothetical protein
MEIKGQPAVYTARDDIVEVFADGVHNLSLNDGVLRVELTATRMVRCTRQSRRRLATFRWCGSLCRFRRQCNCIRL